MKTNCIVILGPTASGKTRLAAELAYRINGEIISADSRQVYREMNIGTGKDYADYNVNGKHIPYHLIDIAHAGTHYHLHRYMVDFKKVFIDINQRDKTPIICGGTGLYIDGVLNGFEFASIPVNESLRSELLPLTIETLRAQFNNLPDTPFKNKADVSSHKRLLRAIEITHYLIENPSHTFDAGYKLHPLIIGLKAADLNSRRERIARRLKHRLQNGLINEVERLHQHMSIDSLKWYGLEYKYIAMYLNKELTYAELENQLTVAIQQFAKRQMTYFRKMEREGKKIHWIDTDLPSATKLETVLHLIKK